MHKLSNRSGGVITQLEAVIMRTQKHVSLQTNTEIDKKELKMTNIK